MSHDYVNAIIHCYQDGKDVFKKYRHLHKAKLQEFEDKIARSFPGADYVNYYWCHLPKGNNYAFRNYLTPKEGRSDG